MGHVAHLCPDRERASIAAVAALIILFSPSSIAQIGAILVGGIAGLWLCRGAPSPPAGQVTVPVSRRVGLAALTAFFLLLAGLPVLRGFGFSQGAALFDAFYRSGALVFGGGHVVLPLLREAFVTPGWVSDDAFLAGYGAAQAVPGPLFTFAAYLGAVVNPPPHGLAGAALGLIGIFLPGLLILIGHVAVLGQVPQMGRGAGDDARRQCGGGGPARCGALYPGLDELGPHIRRFRNCPGRLCSSHGLARTAAHRRRLQRARRDRSFAGHVMTGESPCACIPRIFP